MAWGGNGITQKRTMLDQSATIAWGSTVTRVPTRALNQVGYLSRMRIKVPVQATTLTVTAGVSVAAQAAIQRPAGRGIQSFDITAQGIAPFYQVSKGQDLLILEYMNNGKAKWADIGLGLAPDIAPSSPVGALGRIAISLAEVAYQVAAAAVNASTAQNVQYSAVFDVPLTEFVQFPEYTQQTQNGVVTVPAQEVEVGLVTLQNTQQNITPHLTMNPLYSGTVDSPFLQTGGAPTGAMNTLVEFYTEFYDVPASPTDQPPAFSQMFIITRTSTDDGVSGTNVTHTFSPAGLLLRAAHCAYDSNDNLVDISSQGVQAIATYPLPAYVNEGNITFAWGSTVNKIVERFSHNLARALETYGEPPPPGALFLDFFRDRTLTDVVNTAVLPSVRSVITGLPAAVSTLHTIEERMIPVRMG